MATHTSTHTATHTFTRSALRGTAARVARVAVAAAVGTGALVAAGVTTSEPAGAATYEAVTTDNLVGVKSCPKRATSASCPLVGTMQISGSVFYVYCYVSGENINGDSIWYKGAHPGIDYGGRGLRGYVSGYYLSTGHDPRKGVPHC